MMMADSKILCQVCGDPARPKETFFAHYGAICCLSCKAFFRRIFRELKQPEKVKCKAEGKCDPLKKCRKCRFDKCILVGMKPHLVPNEEESKKYTYSNKRSLLKISLALLKAASRPEGFEGLASSIDMMVEYLMTSFNEATHAMKDNAEVIDQILIGHLSSIWTHEHTHQMFKACDYLEKLFAKFAQKIHLFVHLSREDQSLLLSNNSGLYLSYIMARYVNAGNGFDQVSWLFGPNLPMMSLAQIMMLQRIELPTPILDHHPTNAVEANIAKLARLCQMLGHSWNIPQYFNSLMAHCILFSTAHWSKAHQSQLQDAAKIERISKMSSHILQVKMQMLEINLVASFGSLLKQIECQISSLFNSCSQIHNMNKHELTIPENEWIQEKLSLYHQADMMVPVTQDFLLAYQDYAEHKGAPMLTVKVCLTGSAIYYKRFKGLLELLDIEKSLDDVSFQQAIGVTVLKIMTLSSSQDQIGFFAGHLGVATLTKQSLATVDHIHGIQPLELEHASEVQKHLSKRIQDFVQSNSIFVLTIFLLLLDNSEWRELYECTRKLLLKKLTHITLSDPETLINDFILDLREYSKICERWFDLIKQSYS